MRFTRDVANITMDLNDVEHIDFNALGGADTITVNDLTGTESPRSISTWAHGGGDGAAGYGHHQCHQWRRCDHRLQQQRRGHGDGPLRDGDDLNFDANDRIVINGLGGNDVIEATGLGGHRSPPRRRRR